LYAEQNSEKGVSQNMKKCLVVLTGILALVFLVPTASASFIQCANIGGGIGGSSFSGPLTCPAYTGVPAGYHLTGVDLNLYTDAQAPQAASSIIQWTFSNFVGVTQSGSEIIQRAANGLSDYGTCTVIAGSINATCGPTLLSYSASGTTFNAVTVNVLAGVFSGGGVDTAGSISARLQIQYDIASDTPEPTSIALIGGGLLSLGLLGRKRFSRP
jgi:hypothetical protein